MREITYILTLLFAIFCTPLFSQEGDLPLLRQWRAGEAISEAAIIGYGQDNCFTISTIDNETFNRIKGLSFGGDCTLALSDLRHLKVLHRNIYGEILLGELICHREIAEDLISIFKTLYKQSYPIERMVLVDNYRADDELSMAANNSSAFNFRYISGTKRLSNHSYGLAIDINPLYNPYIRTLGGRVIVSPEASKEYADRTISHPYMIKKGDLCHREFLKHGFQWGGSWSGRKDYQHFEKKISTTSSQHQP